MGLRVWLIDPDVADTGASAVDLVADRESAVEVGGSLLGTREDDGGPHTFGFDHADGVVEVLGVGHGAVLT